MRDLGHRPGLPRFMRGRPPGCARAVRGVGQKPRRRMRLGVPLGSALGLSRLHDTRRKGWREDRGARAYGGIVDALTVRHCFNSRGCTDPPVIADSGIATFQLDQGPAVEPDYFEIANAGPRFLGYPSRRWVGKHAEIDFMGSTALLAKAPGLDTGTIIVQLGDCIGSLEVRMVVGSGASITVEGSSDRLYRGPGGWATSATIRVDGRVRQRVPWVPNGPRVRPER